MAGGKIGAGLIFSAENFTGQVKAVLVVGPESLKSKELPPQESDFFS
jgi:hypothetical protein